MIALQTIAIFRDAYRELNARKLFWLAMMLSGIVVLSFAMIGFEDGYLTVLIWKTPLPLERLGMTPEMFFKFVFMNFGIKFWLAWITTIIAIVTTAGMIPDFITGGAIDLALSKPIGRVRLFLTKYAAALLFVALQVTVFTTLAFLVLGLRGKTWEPAVFLAIPLMIVFFSYLYCVSALVGLLTRSTIAAMIITLLFWFFLFLLNTTDSTLIMFKALNQESYERAEQRIELFERQRDERAAASGGGVRGALISAVADGYDQGKIDRAIVQRDAAKDDLESFERWHGRLITVKTVFPKTTETIDLLERALIELVELEQFVDAINDSNSASRERIIIDEQGEETIEEFRGQFDPDADRIASRAQLEEFRARSILWIVGSSLGFEAAVLALCCWIFAKRDY